MTVLWCARVNFTFLQLDFNSHILTLVLIYYYENLHKSFVTLIGFLINSIIFGARGRQNCNTFSPSSIYLHFPSTPFAEIVWVEPEMWHYLTEVDHL